MSLDTEKLAELLTGLAEYVDAVEHERTSKTAAERDTRIEKLAECYEGSTGEALPENVREKLASVEVEALEHLLKIANNNGGSPESLGASADLNNNPPPRTIKEAATQAEDRFIDWIIS